MDRKRRKAGDGSQLRGPTTSAESGKEASRRVVKMVYAVDKDKPNASSTHQVQKGETQTSSPTATLQSAAPPHQPEKESGTGQGDQPTSALPKHALPLQPTGSPRSFDHTVHTTTSADHHRDQCTVCQRYDRLRQFDALAAVDNPLARAAVGGSADSSSLGDRTFRPSADPQQQLETVLRQLKDEYHHLKMSVTS